MISRRAFLASAFVGGSAVGVGLASNDMRADGPTSDFITEHVEVTIPELPSAFEGYRIGFLTDLHIGIWVPQEWIRRALAALEASEIDLLVLGGDYILVNDNPLWQECGIVRNESFAGLSKKAAIPAIFTAFGECFAECRVRDGIVGVVGNHDHWTSIRVFRDVMRGFQNIRILMNEEFSVARGEQTLSFFGVDDYLTGLPTAPPPLRAPRATSSRIIISHNPDYISALLDRPEHDFSFAMCGHTHGGQIVLPVVGPVAAQVVDRRFVAGFERIGEKAVYTSRGLGVVGLPFRINCPAEATIFTLKSA